MYKIIYHGPTIDGGPGMACTDDLVMKEELIPTEQALHARMQELINDGKSPVYRKVDEHGNHIN